MVNKRSTPGQCSSGPDPDNPARAGEKRLRASRITVFDYDQDTLEERTLDRIEDAFAYRQSDTVTWINIDGPRDVQLVEKLGQAYGVHPLVLEDVLHTEQRPKLEDYEQYLFVVLRMLREDGKSNRILSEQVSIVCGANFVISFQQEDPGDVFGPVRDRLRGGQGRLRQAGADYLLYSLMDAVVDNYFVILEDLGEDIEKIEEAVAERPTSQALKAIKSHNRKTIFLRKSVWPLREAVAALERSDSPLVAKDTRWYFRDLYDHTIQLIDTLEISRDLLGSLLHVYLSSVSNRLNEVMKLLTIIATIFIPMTFIASLYGMNFQNPGGRAPLNMPELYWRYGYVATLAVMAAVAGGMLLYFRRKRWF